MWGFVSILVLVLTIWAIGVFFYSVIPGKLSERPRIAIASLLTVATLAGLFFLWGGMSTARGPAERTACRANLHSLYALIQEFVTNHGRLPMDEQGQLSLNELFETSSTQHEWHACCDDDVASCYLWGAVSPGDIPTSDSEFPKILLYDRPGNHMLTLANGLARRVDGVRQEAALLLLSDGSIFSWHGDSPAYESWAKQYSEGLGESFPPGVEDRIREGERGIAW